MKVGDLVMVKRHPKGGLVRTGVLVDVIQKKCWRTTQLGHSVDWNKIDPEPHGIVMFDDNLLTIPATDIEVINESR
ncbi:MAG: hypothetical protein VXW71_02035 [Actinomycetota bacterium]|nr:hypothetical protein [Actinomycetota bacterium]